MKKYENHLKACVFCLLALGLMFFPKASAGASTIYVGPSELHTTIQAGIVAAADGDTVVVRSGTYSGDGNKGLNFGGKAITVRSENGPEACIIDCEGMGVAFTFENNETSSSVVDGFTITRSDTGGKSAIYCYNSSPTITNCIIKGNSSTYGGGLYCYYQASPNLINCIFTGNSARRGGAVYCFWESSPTFIHCTISGNAATELENFGGEGGGIHLLNSFATMTNCIVLGNTADIISPDIYVSPTSSTTVTFSAFPELWDGEGNILIEESPFVGEGDYHLKEGSECIDQGTDQITLPEFDFEGDPRNLGAAPDMGADESESSAKVPEDPVKMDVKMDVRPFARFNIINLKSRGVVPVAIFGDKDLDVSDIDVDSVAFAGAQCVRSFIKDVNHDGEDDLLLFFRTRELNLDLTLSDRTTREEATLTGFLEDGTELVATDTIRLVPKRACQCKKKGMPTRRHGRYGW